MEASVAKPGDAFASLRARIVEAMIRVACWLALPAWIFSVWASIQGHVPGVAAVDTLIYGWLLALRFWPGVGAVTRAANVIVLLHLIGANLLFALGPMGHGVMWLMGSSLAAVVLLPPRFSRYAFFAQGLTTAAASVAYAVLPEAYFHLPLVGAGWYAFAASSLLLTGALAAALRSLLDGLFEALERSTAEHARLQAETERRALLERDLEARVEERTRDLTAANADLERFARSVSHDLRTPLHVIGGFASLIAETDREGLAPASIAHLARIQAAVSRGSSLIDGLLAHARHGNAALDRMEVDLVILARELVDSRRVQEPARVVEFSAPAQLRVHADPQLIRVVLDNLLSNAWKFSSRKARAHIRLGLASVNGEPAIYVEDNGVGFPADRAGKLFGEFSRLHEDREFPGTGIGLATVARVVARHGGRIWAQSEPGLGAAFWFTLGQGAIHELPSALTGQISPDQPETPIPG